MADHEPYIGVPTFEADVYQDVIEGLLAFQCQLTDALVDRDREVETLRQEKATLLNTIDHLRRERDQLQTNLRREKRGIGFGKEQ